MTMNRFALARRRRGRGALVLGALLSAPAPALAGQLTDRGTFRITIDGVDAGEEDFLIERSAAGARARGTVTMLDGRTVTTFLDLTGAGLRLSTYRASATGPDTTSVFVAARADGALDARMTGPWGEEVREYRAHPSTVVLDDGVAHHFFVLSTALAGERTGAVHALGPLARREEDDVAIAVDAETIQVDGEEVAATRVRLGAGEAARSAWFDGGGRLVRVAVPSQGFLAQRAGPG